MNPLYTGCDWLVKAYNRVWLGVALHGVTQQLYSAGSVDTIGKRSRHKVPTRLLRLRAPPHVRASLPSSDSSRPLTQTALSTFLVVLMFATHLTVENQASGLQLRPLPVGLPFPQELDLNLNDRVLACISPWLFLHVSFVYHVI